MALFKLSYSGQQFGPHTQGELADMLADGSIDQSAQVWQEGWPTWRPVTALIPVGAIPASPIPTAQVVHYAAANKQKLSLRVRRRLKRYRLRVGHRSFIFQAALLGWTLLYLLWMASVAISAADAVSSLSSAFGPTVPRFTAPSSSGPGVIAMVAGLLTGLMGAGAGWALIGLPLFIAAVATMENHEA